MIISVILLFLLGRCLFNIPINPPTSTSLLMICICIVAIIFIPIKYMFYRFDVAIGSKSYLGTVKMKYKMLKDLDRAAPDNFIHIPMMDREFATAQIGYCLGGSGAYHRIDYIIVLPFIDYHRYKISRLFNLFSANRSQNQDALITVLEDVQKEIERRK